MADTTGSRDTATPSPPATTDLASLLKITPKISKKLANEDDYPAWRFEAERQIWRMKLTDVVTGSETDEPATGIDTWKDKTYKALDYIMDSCEQEPQLKTRAAATAAEAWTILKENYEGKRRTHLSHLFYSVAGSRFDDRKTIIKAHIETFEKAWLSLAQAVATVTPSPTTCK